LGTNEETVVRHVPVAGAPWLDESGL